MAESIVKTLFTGDPKPLENAAKRGEAAGASMRDKFKSLAGPIAAAFSVTAIAKFTRDTLKAADAIDNVSDAMGLNTERVQTLQVLAGRAGVSFEKVQDAIMRTAKEGVSFDEVAKAMVGAKDATMSQDEAIKILGRNALYLNDVFVQVADQGLDGLKNGLLETGEIMSNDIVQAADKMEEAMDKAFTKIKVGMQSWVTEMLGGLYSFGKGAQRALQRGVRGQGFGAGWQEGFAEASQDLFGDLSAAGKGGFKKTSGISGSAKGGRSFAAPEVSQAMSPVDSLAAIGGLMGSQINVQSVAERQLKLQESSEKILELIAKEAEKTSKNTERLNED